MGRLVSYLVSRLIDPGDPPAAPPVAGPPAVRVTPRAERQRVDDRLRSAEARLAALQSLAGLDELRGRGGGRD